MKLLNLKFSQKIYLIFSLTYCLLCFTSKGQEPVYWQLTDKDGLPSLTVYEILQDDLGFIWMGTANGLCKYDGRSFVSYPDNSLKDNEILKIRKDNWNRIWFFNLSGQLAYIKKNQRVQVYTDSIIVDKKINNIECKGNSLCLEYKDQLSGQFGVLCYSLFLDKSPTLNLHIPDIFNQNIELQSYEDSLIVIENFVHRDHNIFKNNPSIKFDRIKKVALGSTHKRDIIISLDPIFQHCYLNNSSLDDKFKKITVIDNANTIQLISIPSSIAFANFKKIENTFWMLGSDGVWNCELNNQLNSFIPAQEIFKLVSANDITLDRENNYWIPTTSQGVRVVPSLSIKLLNSAQGNLPNNEVYRLFYDAQLDRVISGHANGKIAIHKNNQNSQIIDLKTKGRVLDIAQSHQQKFYFILDYGIVILDQKLKSKLLGLNFSGSKTIMGDSQSRIWLGTGHKVYLTDQTLSSFKNEIIGKRTYAIHEDSSKRTWLGTTEGLYFHQDTLSLFLKENITSITESIDSIVWVSTNTNGIFGIKNQQIIHHFTTDDGLISSQCKRVFSDNSKLLWIATNKGVNFINLQNKNIGLITKKDGLPSDEINDIIVVKNQVWVATPIGLANFPKNIIHQNTMPPPIYLNSLQIWDQKFPIDSNITISHHQNNLQFNFIGLGFRAKNSISYKYKMSDIDQNWVYTNNTFARYPIINPGSYQFEVYAINEDGVESLHPATVSINIAFAWWQNDWLKTLAFICSILLISYFFQYRFQKKEEKKQIQNKINQLKQQALQAQMNPHFIFNVLGAIQNALTTNDQERAMLYLSRFSKMIRSIFQYSKQKKISLETEIAFLKLYLELESLRFKHKIKLDFNITAELKNYVFETKIPPLLLQPLIENAFKHGLFHKESEGHLKINFSKKNQFLNFIIEDNGIGRKKAQAINQSKLFYEPGQNSGIKIIRERLQIINQVKLPKDVPSLEITDIFHQGNVVGTKVSLLIFCDNFN